MMWPDNVYVVSLVSQFVNSPCDCHWDAVVRILRYIKGAPGKGLIYKDKGNTDSIAYTDSDWVGCPSNSESTFGYCVLISENFIEK